MFETDGSGGVGVALEITTRRGRERVREVFTGRKVASLSPAELEHAQRAGYEPDGEYLVGRDPREMTRDQLEATGHEPMSPTEAIRAKCLDCCAGSAHEVRCCVAMACPSWPFRTGKNPWRAPASEAQREASRRNAARMHAASFDTVKITGASDEVPASVPEEGDMLKRRMPLTFTVLGS